MLKNEHHRQALSMPSALLLACSSRLIRAIVRFSSSFFAFIVFSWSFAADVLLLVIAILRCRLLVIFKPP